MEDRNSLVKMFGLVHKPLIQESFVDMVAHSVVLIEMKFV